MFINNTAKSRDIFFTTWEKTLKHVPLTKLEEMISKIITNHPEYQYIFDPNNKISRTPNYLPLDGSNPFLHLSLHLAVMEQLSVDSPTGISAIYERLLLKIPDQHLVEHQLMDCLAETIWQSQIHASPISPTKYIDSLLNLLARVQ